MAGEREGGFHRDWRCRGGGEVPRGVERGGEGLMEGGGAVS